MLLHFFQKDTIPLFRDVFEKLRDIIYNDTKDEMAEEFENRMSIKQEEIDKLRAEKRPLSAIIKYPKQEEKLVQYTTKSDDFFLSRNDIDIKTIVEQTLKYKEKTLTMLRSEANEKGVVISKGMKQDDIIALLMTTQSKDLFDNE